MLVLMTWYSDDSTPSLYFFEETGTRNIESPIFRLIPKLFEEVECRKKAAVYKIGALDKQPVLLFPKE